MYSSTLNKEDSLIGQHIPNEGNFNPKQTPFLKANP